MNFGGGPPGVEEISETSKFVGELFVRLFGFGVLVVGLVVGAFYCFLLWKRPDSDPYKGRYNMAFALLLLFTTGGGVANCHGNATGLLVSLGSFTALMCFCIHWWVEKERPP